MTPTTDRLREAFEHEDLDAFVAALDPDVVWRGIGEPGVAPPLCSNREEVRRVFKDQRAEGRRGSPEIVAESGDRIVVAPHAASPPEGLEELHHVYTIRYGRIVEIQDYPNLASALEAAGLS
jgi:ketosteroid isomerase-like protein